MKIREARPTEYRGVRFRSKSEAIFARTLDLAGGEWRYEPSDSHYLCGHQWDFQFYSYHSDRLWLIEYKPSAPTKTYVETLTERVSQLFWKNVHTMNNEKIERHESILVWGSPYQGPPPSVSLYQGYRRCSYVAFPICTTWCKFGRFFDQSADNSESIPVSFRHDIFEMLGIDETLVQTSKQYRFDLRKFNAP